MHLTRCLATALMALAATSCAQHGAKSLTAGEWDQCAERAEASVDYDQVGMVGIEDAIITQCGAPPAPEPSQTTGAVGMSPYDLVRTEAWKPKFVAVTQDEYPQFVDRLGVSSPMTLQGEWVVGQGNAVRSGGIDEAALAIGATSGRVYGAMMRDGSEIIGFGFDDWGSAPPYLQAWRNTRR
jgi:hypothetical protein